MFVKRTVRRRGDKSYEYLSLVEAVREDGRNTHHTLLRLGEVSELRSSGQIDRIIRALRAYAEGTWFEAGELSGELSHVLFSTEFLRMALPVFTAYWHRRRAIETPTQRVWFDL